MHAKVCIIDDAWASVGSDNMNRRSWTSDSELTAAIVDGEHDEREPRDPRGDAPTRRFARNLRLRLALEHLDRDKDDDDAGSRDADLLDPDAFVTALQTSADRLDRWYAEGRLGERPPGRIRRHKPAPVPWYTRLWAAPVYRILHDPDGRPIGMRRRGQF